MTKYLKAYLRVCHRTSGTQVIDILHAESLQRAIISTKKTLRENPEYPRIVLHDGDTSKDPVVWDSFASKPRYQMVNPVIIPASSLMIHLDHIGKFVAKGCVLDSEGEPNERPTRTSLIIKIDIEQGYIETLNSIYEIV